MKIVTILGARPQFVKAAVVSRAMRNTQKIQEIIVHTGQHFDANMSDVFFEQMQIPKPNYKLDIHSGTHGDMTGRMLVEIEKVLLTEQPDWVLVYGDTNSTLAGALAASKLHIKVAHVEAGLRSFNMRMPEEINRILTDRVSSQLFCPTQSAIANLHNEGYQHIRSAQISLSGDVMYDAALHYAQFDTQDQVVNTIISSQPYMLVTIHRAENTDDPQRLAAIFAALDRLSQDIRVVMPLHPRTRKLLQQHSINPKVSFIDPVGYIEMVKLLKHCDFVLTDSGGLQKEAYFFDKYCVTARDETEWVELVEHGYNQLVGADQDKIITACQAVLGQSITDKKMLYGEGKASELIAMELLK